MSENAIPDSEKPADRSKVLQAVIQTTQEILQEMPTDHPARGIILAKLTEHLNERYKRSGAIGDLQETFRTFREAVKISFSVESNRLVGLGYEIYGSLLFGNGGVRGFGGLDGDITAGQFNLPSSELIGLASHGSIVGFDVTKVRSDAIIITDSEIKTINLPDLKQPDLVEKLVLFDMLCSSPWSLRTKADRNRQLRDILLWLWNVAVEPVLRELKLLGGQKEVLQRVWWVASGLMGRLPIHAAGEHSKRSLQNTFNNVISSYTPSLKALAHLKKKEPSNQLWNKVLVVAMPKTPGQDSLNVEEEVAAITKAISTSKSTTIRVLGLPVSQEAKEYMTPAYKRTVLEELQTCNIAHFACHGVSSWVNPLDGGLLLKHPTDETTTEILTIQDIKDVSQSHARIAYLSACSTAESSPMLQDEAVHLASGFQSIGFPHVIGTVWKADDDASVGVAGKFYEIIFRQADGVMEDRMVAVALHEAVGVLREEDCEDVLTWAPYVHLGV